EARQHRAFRQLQLPREVARRRRMETAPRQLCRGRFARAGGKSEAAQPFALAQERIEPARGLGGIDSTQQLEIVALEHDTVIAGALLQMAAARRQGEAEPGPGEARPLEILDGDDDMVDAGERRRRHRRLASMLPPSTVRMAAVVVRASARKTKASATSSAVTSRPSRLPLI